MLCRRLHRARLGVPDHPSCGTARIRGNERVIAELRADEPFREPMKTLEDTEAAPL